MRILLTGASGMVGQGVLRECLLAPEVDEVVAPVRHRFASDDTKLTQTEQQNFLQWNDRDLANFGACFFCLGTSAVGKTEAEYRHITYDVTLALATALLKASPQAVFVYISGAGTNAQGRAMWARVKGETEAALLAMPFRGVYCFRPGYIQPLHGIRSKVGWYQALYDLVSWGYPVFRRFPQFVTSTEDVGLAMLQVAVHGWPAHVLESREINAAAQTRRAATRQ